MSSQPPSNSDPDHRPPSGTPPPANPPPEPAPWPPPPAQLPPPAGPWQEAPPAGWSGQEPWSGQAGWAGQAGWSGQPGQYGWAGQQAGSGPARPPKSPAYPPNNTYAVQGGISQVSYPQDAPPPTRNRTNIMAVVTLVAAFVFAPAGIVCGHIARQQIQDSGEDGLGLATTGLVISYVITTVALISCCGLLTFSAFTGGGKPA